MTTTPNLTAGTTEVRIMLLSCGHVEWRKQPFDMDINTGLCPVSNEPVTIEHYIDELATDAGSVLSGPAPSCPVCGNACTNDVCGSDKIGCICDLPGPWDEGFYFPVDESRAG